MSAAWRGASSPPRGFHGRISTLRAVRWSIARAVAVGRRPIPPQCRPVVIPAGPIDWGDLAGGAGYFDQAHFGHEFRAFTGLTPTRYVEVRRRFLREHPGHALDSWPLPAD